MAEMTEAQRKAFEAALARSQAAEQQREQVQRSDCELRRKG